jgi:ribosomal protein L16 Arg81 hydroxylase
LHSDAHGWSSVIFMTDEVGATVGEHVDNEDVYTVQLYGSKRWTVDPPDLDWLRARVLGGELARLNPSESWVRNRPASVAFQRPTEYLVDPGDLLAMPAFCLHEVIALGPMETAAFNISICQEQDWR